MGELTASLAAETEALRAAYAALNRNDIPAMVRAFDPQIEWTDPAEYPGAGAYHGRAGAEEHLSQMRGLWTEGSCEPQRFIVAGDKILVFVDVHVRLKHETEWREGHLADVYSFRNGKATAMRAFADRRQALEWAGSQSLKCKLTHHYLPRHSAVEALIALFMISMTYDRRDAA